MKTVCTFILTLTAILPLFAQTGIGTQTPNPDASLELGATDKGLLMNRIALTGTTNPTPLSAHVSGMTVYNTATAGDVTPGYYYDNGTQWVRIGNADEEPFRNVSDGSAATNASTNIYYDGGNMGIGTNNPSSRLTVSGIDDNQPQVLITSSSATAFGNYGIAYRALGTGGVWTGYLGNNPNISLPGAAVIAGAGKNLYLMAGPDGNSLDPSDLGNVPRITVLESNGYVGIGNTAPAYPLHVTGTTGGSVASSQRIIANNSGGATWVQNINPSGNIGIFTERWICTNAGYVAHSDARIKNITGISDSQKDLEKLSQIEITDYTKIDKIKDSRHYKKVIAQQVEQIYPLAVINSTDYIPDVYETALSVSVTTNGITTLTTKKEHGFSTGDKVRLETAEKGPAYFPVTVLDAQRFTVAHHFGTDKVFVYGKQVDDFKSVDYEAIAMLNVSATQELAKQVEALKKALLEKEGRIDFLEAQAEELRELKAEMVGIRALLQSSPMVQGTDSQPAPGNPLRYGAETKITLNE